MYKEYMAEGKRTKKLTEEMDKRLFAIASKLDLWDQNQRDRFIQPKNNTRTHSE